MCIPWILFFFSVWVLVTLRWDMHGPALICRETLRLRFKGVWDSHDVYDASLHLPRRETKKDQKRTTKTHDILSRTLTSPSHRGSHFHPFFSYSLFHFTRVSPLSHWAGGFTTILHPLDHPYSSPPLRPARHCSYHAMRAKATRYYGMNPHLIGRHHIRRLCLEVGQEGVCSTM